MINCPVCQTNKVDYRFSSTNKHGRNTYSKEQFKIYYCHNCQSHFPANLTINQHYYQRYYPDNYYPSDSLIIKSINYICFSFREKLIKHNNPNNTIDILDIGCGRGEFLQHLPSNKYNKYGIEINQDASAYCQKNNIKIIGQDINQTKTNLTFDCITLWHVLEHLPNPSSSLKIISRLLKPNGQLILATPNSASLGFLIGKANYFHLDSPRHIFIPNQTTIRYLMKNSEYTNIKFTNPFYDYPLDLLWSTKQSLAFPFVATLYPALKLLSPETIITLAQKS